MEKKQSQKFLRQRKFLLVMPVLIVPFLIMFFWALGGGNGQPKDTKVSQLSKGINTRVPDAHFNKEKGVDKFSFYEQADKDSLKFKEALKNDPYRSQENAQSESNNQSSSKFPFHSSANQSQFESNLRKSLGSSGNYLKSDEDPNEQKVNAKLAQLYAELNKKESFEKNKPLTGANGISNYGELKSNPDLNRLEKVLQGYSKEDRTEDPQIKQLDSLLNKVIDIQHPERLAEKNKDSARNTKKPIFEVRNHQSSKSNVAFEKPNPDSLSENPDYGQSSFYGFDPSRISKLDSSNAIRAIIHETQVLISGATIKLRLLDDIFINGHRIPKDHFVFGKASLNADRLNIAINSIEYNNSVFPVNLKVYDFDGIEGIPIHDAISRKVAKQSADNAIETMQLASLDPSIGAQAATAGINAAKSLIGKNIKIEKVTVPVGHRVLLENVSQKQ